MESEQTLSYFHQYSMTIAVLIKEKLSISSQQTMFRNSHCAVFFYFCTYSSASEVCDEASSHLTFNSRFECRFIVSTLPLFSSLSYDDTEGEEKLFFLQQKSIIFQRDTIELKREAETLQFIVESLIGGRDETAEQWQASCRRSLN